MHIKKFRPRRDSNPSATWLLYTSVVLYQLSYQAIWELFTLWVHNIPIDGEEYVNWLYMYERSCIN